MIIGIDFGGVIIKTSQDGQLLDPDCGEAIVQPFAIESVKTLCLSSNRQVWIISKASYQTQKLTREWLAHVRFYRRTGFEPEHLIFCEKRKDKAGLCQRYEITHFLDDSAEVLQFMVGLVPNLYHFGGTDEENWQGVSDWREFMNALRGRL